MAYENQIKCRCGKPIPPMPEDATPEELLCDECYEIYETEKERESIVMMGATKKGEYYRTCEMLVDIAEEKGVYFAVAFLLDSEYDRKDIKEILPILQKTKGARKI